MKIKVIDIFCDKFTGEVYNPGTILDFEDEARVKDLSERKLAEIIEEKKASKGIVLFEQEFEKKDVVEALKSIGVSVTANMREGTLLSKAGELDEEKTSALKEALGIE
mgnify:FL=1|jgi:hypothetical protein